MKNLKIMIINDQVDCLEHHWKNLEEKGLKFDIDMASSAMVASACYKPQDYDLMIIDASDDVTLNNNQMASEYWKTKNPSIIIIGTSVQRELINDRLSKKLYDEVIHLRSQELDETLIEILKKRELIPEEIYIK